MQTVLLVEDNDDIREMVADAVRAEGYEVREAENGQIAIEILGELKDEPCLVLLDWMMPVMDGRMFLEALSEAHRLACLPVVVVSAAVSDHAAGARRVVKKPVSVDLLLRIVREYCGAGNECSLSARDASFEFNAQRVGRSEAPTGGREDP